MNNFSHWTTFINTFSIIHCSSEIFSLGGGDDDLIIELVDCWCWIDISSGWLESSLTIQRSQVDTGGQEATRIKCFIYINRLPHVQDRDILDQINS